MPQMPSGFLTFLFTDIEGSTQLWEERTEAMWETLQRHDSVMRQAIQSEGGYIFKTVGDAFCATFHSSDAALRAVIAAQQALFQDPHLNGELRGFAVRVRMGLHCGEARQTENDYFGPVVNRAARVAGVAHGGQVVLSAAIARRVTDSLPESVTLKELGLCLLKGLDEPETLFQVMHPDLPADFPPLPLLSTVRTNLPSESTTFIGRSQERAELCAWLTEKRRLVTILGPGGSGKTRLAQQVGADLIESFPGGVWWVDLTSLTDSSQVIPAIAAVFDLKESTQSSLTHQIAERLKSQPALLLLDNFEQVTGAASDIDTLLRLCPMLTILVTSRSLLNLSLEQELSLSELSMEEALDLFTLRLQQARPSFRLDDSNRLIVRRIVQRLDFNPLALELAAAQARLLQVAQIEKQLSQRFRLLVSPYRDVQLRQKTLRGALDWSYDILNEEDQALFLELSAFAGRFQLDDALAVCEGEDVIAGLMRLRDQSLLRMEETDSSSWFRMQESLREYGQEKARTLGKEGAINDRMARYFADLAAELTRDSSDPDTYARLRFYRDNLRTALEWLIAHRNGEEAADLCQSLQTLWERQGTFREGSAFLARTAELLTGTGRQGDLLRRAGWLTYLLGEYPAAEALLRQSQQIFREQGMDYDVAKAQNERALIAQAEGRYTEARTLFLESLRYAEETGDEARQAARLSNLGLLETAEKRFEEARAYLSRALGIYERQGNVERTATCLCNMSDLALSAGDWDSAASFARRSEQKSRSIDDETGILYALVNLAQAERLLSHDADAKKAVLEGLSLCRQTEQWTMLPSLLLASLSEDIGQVNCALLAAIERLQVLHNGPFDTAGPLLDRYQRIQQQWQEQSGALLQSERQQWAKTGWEEICLRVGNLLQA